MSILERILREVWRAGADAHKEAWKARQQTPRPKPIAKKPYAPKAKNPEGFGTFVNRADVLIIDTETTGISERSEVLQVGIINTRGEMLLNRLCVPIGRISTKAREVRGIDRKRVKREGLPFPDVFAEMRPIFEGANVVFVWNMPFDRRLLNQSCARHGLSMPALRWRCAMREYASVRRRRSEYVKLAKAVRAEGVEVEAAAHSATGDCARVLGVMRVAAEA